MESECIEYVLLVEISQDFFFRFFYLKLIKITLRCPRGINDLPLQKLHSYPPPGRLDFISLIHTMKTKEDLYCSHRAHWYVFLVITASSFWLNQQKSATEQCTR